MLLKNSFRCSIAWEGGREREAASSGLIYGRCAELFSETREPRELTLCFKGVFPLLPTRCVCILPKIHHARWCHDMMRHMTINLGRKSPHCRSMLAMNLDSSLFQACLILPVPVFWGFFFQMREALVKSRWFSSAPYIYGWHSSSDISACRAWVASLSTFFPTLLFSLSSRWEWCLVLWPFYHCLQMQWQSNRTGLALRYLC